MNCRNHAGREGVTHCQNCGDPLCEECAIGLQAGTWCRRCLDELVTGRHRELARLGRSRLVAALLSIIPGLGHMYLGMIGKGFSLMALLFSSVFLVILYSVSTGMFWMTAYIIPTLGVLFLSYAVFDALAAAERLRRGARAEGSDDELMRAVWERVFLNGRFAGIVLIVAGAVGVLDLFAPAVDRVLQSRLSSQVSISAIVIPIALLVAGVILLRRAGRR